MCLNAVNTAQLWLQLIEEWNFPFSLSGPLSSSSSATLDVGGSACARSLTRQ